MAARIDEVELNRLSTDDEPARQSSLHRSCAISTLAHLIVGFALMHRGISAAVSVARQPVFVVDVVENRPAVGMSRASPVESAAPPVQRFTEPPLSPPAPAKQVAEKKERRRATRLRPAEHLTHREEPVRQSANDALPMPAAHFDDTSRSHVAADAEAVRLARTSYSSRLLSLLNKHKEYPVIARRRGLEGTVLVRIDLLRDGSLGGYRVEKSSGFDVLDESATTLVAKATPYPPLPESIPGERAVFLVPVTFRLN